MNKNAKIFVAGHNGLVGSAVVRKLSALGYKNLLLRTHKELDLTHQGAVDAFFAEQKPEFVVLAAAHVGGILANSTHPAEFIYRNLAIQTNVIDAAYRNSVNRLVFLGSSCIYPKLAPQPLREEYLLSGPLEPTNDAYAIAKISGVKMCQAYNKQYGTAFVPVMPTNLYGPGDNFGLATSHVLPALIRKAHEAKENDSPLVVWGSGTPRREFLHVDDLSTAIAMLLFKPDFNELVNIGTGEDVSIKELAEMVCEAVGFKGEVKFDASRPDGTPRKVLDVSKIHALGWKAEISLKDGLADTYKWFLEHPDSSRR